MGKESSRTIRCLGFLKDVLADEKCEQVLAGGWGFAIVQQSQQLRVVGRNLSYTSSDLSIFCAGETGTETVEASSFWLHVCLVEKEKGCLWTWGLNNHRQCLGQGDVIASRDVIASPLRRVPFKHKVVQTCAGELHSLLLTDSGCVFSWGCNKDGALGIGESVGLVAKEPLHVGSIKAKVLRIACGATHSLAITDTNEDKLLSWGLNNHGQCGLNSDACDKVFLPLEVKHLTGMSLLKVCAGIAHTVVLTKFGIQTFGWGTAGQLGCRLKESSGVPLLVEGLSMDTVIDDINERTVDISCGSMHTVVLLRSVKSVVYGFGSNRQLQLVDDADYHEKSITSPIVIYDGDRRVKQAICTYWSTILLLENKS